MRPSRDTVIARRSLYIVVVVVMRGAPCFRLEQCSSTRAGAGRPTASGKELRNYEADERASSVFAHRVYSHDTRAGQI